MKSLLVIGDSHSVIWGGNDVLAGVGAPVRFTGVQVVHLGPALAFNLIDRSSQALGKWGLQVESYVNVHQVSAENTAAILLCFGEIDIRTQIVRRAAESGQNLQSVVKSVVDRLFAFVRWLHNHTKVPVLVWEPVPTSSSKDFSFNPAFPAVGSELERNVATQLFSLAAQEHAEQMCGSGARVYAFGAFDELTSGLETCPEFFRDGCHLNLLGLSIAVRKLRTLSQTYGLGLEDHFPPSVFTRDSPVLADISATAKIQVFPNAIPGRQASRLVDPIYTGEGENPYVLFDLGFAALVRKIEIFNRRDGEHALNKNIRVMVGNTTQALVVIHAESGEWGADGVPITVPMGETSEPVRFIAIQLLSANTLVLAAVKIFALSLLYP